MRRFGEYALWALVSVYISGILFILISESRMHFETIRPDSLTWRVFYRREADHFEITWQEKVPGELAHIYKKESDARAVANAIEKIYRGE